MDEARERCGCGGDCGCKPGGLIITWEPLPDLSEKSMAALLDGVGGEQLQRSARQLVASLDDPNGVISAFSSFLAT